MAFKQNPDKKVRLEELNKTALIKTVKQLRTRETRLLNQIAKLEKIAAERSLLNSACDHNAGLRGAGSDTTGADLSSGTAFPWEDKS